MANISELLKKIKSARYGRDVRDSIHDAIQAMNTDIENNVPAVQNLTERAESASSSAKTYSTDASAAATNAKNYSDSAKQYSESAASAIARAYDTETTAEKRIANTIEASMLVTNATRNLLNPTLQTITQNGVTCTNNGDGTYTFTGTATGTATFIVQDMVDFVKKPINKDIRLVGCPKNGGVGNKYRLQFLGDPNSTVYDVGNGGNIHFKNITKNANVAIIIDTGITATNLVFKPMLTADLNATYDDFVPYSGYDVKSCGKNIVENTLINTTINGITSVLNPDCSISFNGTSSAIAIFTFAPKALKTFWNNCKGDVKLLGCPTDSPGTSSHFLQIWTPNGKTFVDDGKGIVIKESDRVGIPFGNIAIIINAGKTLSNVVFKPMLTTNLDATYDDYEPYTESTVHIDSSTQFPLLGLKSFDGETNIIGPANVEVSHALTDTGKYVMQNMKDISDIKAAIVASGSTTE